MSMKILGVPFGEVVLMIAAAILIWAILFAASTQETRREFGVWIPSQEQRALVRERNKAREDWLKLRDLIDAAERRGMEASEIGVLRGAAVNARDRLSIAESAIMDERARLTVFDDHRSLIDKWR